MNWLDQLKSNLARNHEKNHCTLEGFFKYYKIDQVFLTAFQGLQWSPGCMLYHLASQGYVQDGLLIALGGARPSTKHYYAYYKTHKQDKSYQEP